MNQYLNANSNQQYSPRYFHSGPELASQNFACTDANQRKGGRHYSDNGAGIPDIVAAIFKPQLLNLARTTKPNISIVSYLRTTGLAKKDTIARKLLLSSGAIESQLEMYQEIGVIQKINNAYCMQDSWKNLISEIVSVEAKVSNWKRAANQAIRNKLFSHYSYVAFPTKVANRVKSKSIFKDNGLGILGIEGDTMVLVKNARKSSIFIWEYYYKLAHYIAIYYSKEKDAI